MAPEESPTAVAADDITAPPADPERPPPPGAEIQRFTERLQPLQGRWQSLDDPRVEILILKSIWIEGIDGKEHARAVLEWADGCRAQGGTPDPEGTFLNLLSPDLSRCFSLQSATADTLTLIEYPGEETLQWVRSQGIQP